MVITSTFWKSHGGLGQNSRSEGEQLGSCKELMSTVPVQLPLITWGRTLGPKNPALGDIRSWSVLSAHAEWDLRMCFIFHSMETVNMHNFLEPFFFRKWEVFSESSSLCYGADWCPGSGPSSVLSDMPVCKTWSLTIIVIICYMAVL